MQRLSGVRKRSTLVVMRKCAGLLLLLLFFFLVVAFVNPLRQVMIQDDWSYALTVRHLLTTGEYKLHDWAAANMPVQIYWAGFLTQVFGYSFIVLRCSTVILLFTGLLALYRILRDFGVGEGESSLLTLTVLSSPAVLFLSFTFQTDVQFLGWQVLALWLYSRALRRENYGYMALASLAAFAAVGTRQFGAALVAGLATTYLIFEQERLRKASLYFVGLALPLLMTLWQFSSGINRPTFSQKVRLAEQLAYLHHVSHLLGDFLWRPTVILQYVGLFLFPLLPVLVILARNHRDGLEPDNSGAQPSRSRSAYCLLGGWILYLTAGVCFGYFFYLPRILMPYLAWLLPNSQTSPFGFKKHVAITVLTSGVAVVLGWLLSRRYAYRRNWPNVSVEEWFVVFSGLALLGLQLLYTQFYDVYLIQFVPFAVIAVGKMAPRWPRWCKGLSAMMCLVMLSISSCWTRGTLAQAEAKWQAAELIHSSGVTARDVGGNQTWSCYYGAFDEWIAEIGGSNASDRYIGSHRMHFAFFDFLNQRFSHASFILSPSVSQQAGKKSSVIATVPYRDEFLRARQIEIVKNN